MTIPVGSKRWRLIWVVASIAGVVAGLAFLLWPGSAQAPVVAEVSAEVESTSRVAPLAGDPIPGDGPIESPERATAATPTTEAEIPLVYFQYEGGARAANLSLHSVEVHAEASFVPRFAEWPISLGSRGEIRSDVLERLGPVILVRLSHHAAQLVELSANRASYDLTPVIVQTFELDLPPEEGEFFVDFRVFSASMSSYGHLDSVMHDARTTSFLDNYCIEAGSSVDPTPIVFARLRLERREPKREIQIVVGRYALEEIDCSFGWALRFQQVVLAGEPLRLSAERVPIAHVFIEDSESSRQIPGRVSIVERRSAPGTAASQAELELPFRVVGDEIQIAVTWRASDERLSTYALKLYWPDGSETTTAFGPWESVLETRAAEKR